jgi:hypothetical protein
VAAAGVAPVIARRDAIVIAVVFLIASAAAWSAMRSFRAEGHRPFFYQSNFEPAVMRACGRGFGIGERQPAALAEFLAARRDDFDCARLAESGALQPLASTANANWYYLYNTAAVVWRVTGVSWTALDGVVAAFSGIVGAALYGLFRLVSPIGVAAGLSLLLVLSPANIRQLPSLRDYSKAPFVLAAVLMLALLVTRAQRRSAIFLLAAAYGALVGFGYGFRSDLAVMVPFGAAIVLVFLPGPFRPNALRNLAAAAILLVSFLLVATPILRSLEQGSCQFHFALLGLTGSAGHELHIAPPLYRFGEPALDFFGNVKVGDYAERVRQQAPPVLCSADYDAVSADLFSRMSAAFPADLVVRAYASVLMILRMGMDVPEIEPMHAKPPAAVAGFYRFLNAAWSPISPLGVLLTIAALGAAWAISIRLGLALSIADG